MRIDAHTRPGPWLPISLHTDTHNLCSGPSASKPTAPLTSVRLELSGRPDLFLTFTAFHGGKV